MSGTHWHQYNFAIAHKYDTRLMIALAPWNMGKSAANNELSAGLKWVLESKKRPAIWERLRPAQWWAACESGLL